MLSIMNMSIKASQVLFMNNSAPNQIELKM